MDLTPREKDKLLIFTAGLVAERRLALVSLDHTIDLHTGRVHAVQVFQGHLQQLRPTAFEQACGITQLQTNPHLTALNIDLTQATGTDRVLIQMGIGVLAQRGFDCFAGDKAHD